MQNYGLVLETEGDYGTEGYVYQELCPIRQFDGRRPVVGSWVIDQVSAGIGLRETAGLVTDNFSSFVPHLFH